MQVEMFSETIHRNGKEYRLVLACDISARVAAEEEPKRSRDDSENSTSILKISGRKNVQRSPRIAR